MIETKKLTGWMVGCDCCDGIMVACADFVADNYKGELYIAFGDKNEALKHAVSYGLNKAKKVEISYIFDDSIHAKDDDRHDEVKEKIL